MTDADLNQFKELRLKELEVVELILERLTHPKANILEIGAGAGWQARRLSEIGYRVEAVEVSTSIHKESREGSIREYDGKNLPYESHYFDVVFSSNTLEHVEEPAHLNAEIIRVLKKDGYAIHYVPTSTWRILSLLTYYPALFKELYQKLSARTSKKNYKKSDHNQLNNGINYSLGFLLLKFMRILVPTKHGAKGSAFGEIFSFRTSSWIRLFQQMGWKINDITSNKMLLTGYHLLGARLSIPIRMRLSRIFGSTAVLFVMSRDKH